MECEISSFPCRYLGRPLSLKRLKVANLQPILDKLADKLLGWKAALLDKSGRLILIKVVLTRIPLYLLIAMDTPRWMIRAIDKLCRGFLWCGRCDAKGGHCPIAWECVARPIHLGGLGIHNLTIMSWTPRMQWLWTGGFMANQWQSSCPLSCHLGTNEVGNGERSNKLSLTIHGLRTLWVECR